MLTPANEQWARASLKKAMRPPTTSEPTAPQQMLTSMMAIRARTFSARLKKERSGKRWVKSVIRCPSHSPEAPPKVGGGRAGHREHQSRDTTEHRRCSCAGRDEARP